jgi:predicted deacylase
LGQGGSEKQDLGVIIKLILVQFEVIPCMPLLSKVAFRSFGLGLAAFLTLSACSLPQTFQSVSPVRLNSAAANSGRAQVVRLHWRNPAELAELAGSGMDLFGIDHQQQTAQARITPNQVVELTQRKIRFDASQVRGMEDARQPLPAGYRTYAQLRQQLQELAAKYPQLVLLEDGGDTWEKTQGKADHDIWVVTLTNRQNRTPKPVTMFTGGVHARELAPVELLMRLMDLLTSEYGKDERITQLLNTHEVVIAPMVNVDGRVQVEKGNSWQRKNTHGTGVDLNRNFDNHWNYQGLTVPDSWKRGLSDPNGEIYSGTAPASEPETQVVQALMQRKKPAIFADIHAYGELMLWPFGYSEKDVPHTPVFKQLYQETVKSLGFKGGTSTQILYPTTATTRDYAYGKHGALSMTLEVGQTFRPTASDVERMWTQLRPSFLRLIEAGGQFGRL